MHAAKEIKQKETLPFLNLNSKTCRTAINESNYYISIDYLRQRNFSCMMSLVYIGM
jgi:hypothetical protein